MSVSFCAKGRLGNNLFQYAAAYAFAKRTGQPLIVPAFEHAERFGLATEPSKTLMSMTSWVSWNEVGAGYRPIEQIPGKNLMLNGYFQSAKYFDDCQQDIRSLLPMKPLQGGVCAVHVRRGDYVGNPHYVDLAEQTDYYEKAYRKFLGMRFLFFSDDIHYCQRKFANWHADFFVDSDPVAAMMSASMCGAKIIANSSFSWWWAFFGQGRIIAPDPQEKWYCGPSADINTNDLIPEGWMTV